MKFGPKINSVANRLRQDIQNDPKLPTVDHGESVAILLWWTFLCDHAEHRDVPVEDLARQQLEAFIPWATEHFQMVREH